MSNYSILRLLEKCLMVLNLFATLFFSAIPLLSTRYIVNYSLAREVLSEVDYAPQNLNAQFLLANLCFLFLLFLLPKGIGKAWSHSRILLVLALAMAGTIFLNVSYNGLILMAFCF